MRKPFDNYLLFLASLPILGFTSTSAFSSTADLPVQTEVGPILGDVYWTPDVVHHIPGVLNISGTLHIAAGTIVKLGDRNDGAVYGRIYVYGTLDLQSTASSKVVFTSWLDDSHGGDSNHDGEATSPGAWGNIVFYATNTLHDCIVRYAGYQPAIYAAGASLTVQGVDISLRGISNGEGNYAFGYNGCSGPIVFTGNTVNAHYGVGMQCVSGDLTVRGNTFVGYTGYALSIGQVTPSQTITVTENNFINGGLALTVGTCPFAAPNNWWGTTSSVEIAAKTSPSGCVHYFPWAIGPFGDPPAGDLSIIAAGFGAQQYAAGDTARLSVAMHSNTVTGNILVAPVLKPYLGQDIPLPPKLVTVTAGSTASCQFAWIVPSVDGQMTIDVDVMADAGSSGSWSRTFDNACIINQLTQSDISQAQLELEACGTTTAQLCGEWPYRLGAALVPFGSNMLSIASFTTKKCLSDLYWEQGRQGQAIAIFTSGLVDLLGSVTKSAADMCTACASTPQSLAVWLTAKLAPPIISSAITCATSYYDLPGGTTVLKSLRTTQSADLSELTALSPDSLWEAFDVVGDTLADLAMCSGSVRMKVTVDSSFTTIDSTGVRGLFVFPIGTNGIACAAMQAGAARLFGNGNNPRSAAVISVQGPSADSCKMVVLHRRSSGLVAKLQYAPFVLDSLGTARLAIASDSTQFPLVVDQNGDGQTDWILYPGGPVVSVPLHAMDDLFLAPPLPNPSRGSTVLRFSNSRAAPTSLGIYDILGRRLKQWHWSTTPAGSHQVVWDGLAESGQPITPGVLFLRLECAGTTLQQKLIHLK